ncbi:MAG: SDR family oxidoreductase [Cytophagales bacterium]|nr:SDR family oxidoreductase [Cytophagales bacterium]
MSENNSVPSTRDVKPNKPCVLITGGSEGIGKAIAIEFAKRQHDLVLVALPDKNLPECAEYIETKYKVKVHPYPTDLIEKDASQRLYEWCVEQGISVNILVNNAGMGGTFIFEKTDISLFEKIVQLNIQPLISLTHLFIPGMKDYPKAYILNVGSVASFYPIPYKSIYAASKSFVYSFSIALSEELKSSSVKVSVLCPGPTLTHAEVTARIEAQGLIGKLMKMSPDEVARIAVNGLLNGKKIIIPGLLNRFSLFVMKSLPVGWLQYIFEKNIRAEAKKNV